MGSSSIKRYISLHFRVVCGELVMPSLSNYSMSIPGSPIRKMLKIMAEARRKGIDLIQFSAGQPSLPPDEEVLKYVAKEIMDKPKEISSYTPTQGIYSLREAIAMDLKRYSGIEIDPETEVTVTEGASEGLFITMFALVDMGEEVILFDPSYVSYAPVVRMVRGVPKSLKVSIESGFQPDVEKIKELVSDKTKAILFASPDNPTGRVIDREIAETIADLAQDHDFWIVVDEAYKHLIYEGEHIWMYKLAPEHTISINSFSKDPAMTGWRLGYIYGPKDAVLEIAKVKQYTTLCSNTPAQIAAIKHLQPEVKDRVLEKTLNIYRERRDAMYLSLIHI